MNRDPDFWPLHNALAWVLTRDGDFAATAKIGNFQPQLPEDGWYRTDDEENGWVALHAALGSGRVKAYRNNDLVPQSDIQKADWAWDDGGMPCLKTNDPSPQFIPVRLRISELIREFPASDPPFSHRSSDSKWESPVGAGDMPMLDAAVWVGSKQSTQPFFLRDERAWLRAYGELVPNILSENLKVFGRHNGYGVSAQVSGAVFSGLEIAPPGGKTSLSLILVERPHLRCDDEEIWAERTSPEYTHLRIEKAGVLKLWPQLTPNVSGRYQERRGPKEQWDWESARQLVIEALDERGDFAELGQQTDWSRKSDVERMVADYFVERTGDQPSESTIRSRVSKIIEAWRQQKVCKGR